MKKLLLFVLILTLTFTSAIAPSVECLEDSDCATDFVCDADQCVFAGEDFCSKDYIFKYCTNECAISDLDSNCFDECAQSVFLENQCREEPVDEKVPEFGILAAGMVLGLAGLFIYKRRR